MSLQGTPLVDGVVGSGIGITSGEIQCDPKLAVVTGIDNGAAIRRTGFGAV